MVDWNLRDMPVFMKSGTIPKHNKRLHTQPGLEIGISHEGRAAMVVGKEVYMQAKRHLIIVPGQVPHQLFPDTSTTYRRTVICLDDAGIKEAVSGALARDLDMEDLLTDKPCQLQLDVESYIKLDMLSKQIKQEMKERREGWKTVVLAHTSVLIVLVGRIVQAHKKRLDRERKQKTASPDHVRLCTDYIAKHLHEPLPLQKMATMFSISPEHLTRLFRKEKGVTFYQYALSARIEESKRLLREQPELGITEIAYILGFSSSPQFNRVFKSIVRQTPTVYRAEASRTSQ
jgi:AraC-like DNA-binding protein